MVEKSPKDPSDPSPYQNSSTQEIDPRCIPQDVDQPMLEGEGIPYPEYTVEQHETWKLLLARQTELVQGRGCQEFLVGLKSLDLPTDRLPALKDLHLKLKRATNWGVARAPGLLRENHFFAALGRRVFPATDYIRNRNELDYTPAPDMFHDIFGHMPMITNPGFSDFYQKWGIAAGRAQGAERRQLERFYWFTVEFGLIETPEGTRIYGNGIISSFREVTHALGPSVVKLPFDPEVISKQEYSISDLQPVLFAIKSFEELQRGFDSWARKLGLL